MSSDKPVSYVYLLHLDQPIPPWGANQHYLGFSRTEYSLIRRLAAHQTGSSASTPFTRAATSRGVHLGLVRLWYGTRTTERKLKNLRNAPRMCPVCAFRHQRGPQYTSLAKDVPLVEIAKIVPDHLTFGINHVWEAIKSQPTYDPTASVFDVMMHLQGNLSYDFPHLLSQIARPNGR